MSVTRRAFMRRAGAFGLGFTGLHALAERAEGWIGGVTRRAGMQGRGESPLGYGPLVADPAGTLDLPAGFSYTEFSRVGGEMADGFLIPGRHDGMAAFPGPGGTTILVRNHENEPQHLEYSPFGRDGARRLPADRLFDPGHGRSPSLGGTTTVVYDTREGRVVREFLSLAGTERNCAGGPTPWGTWLTCEEDTSPASPVHERDHGWVFEVPATPEPAVATPTPLVAMGRFRHEAAAVDPRSGCVYMTEDLTDGLIYRFLPSQPGKLAAGGRLQALRVRGRPRVDTRNWGEPRFPPGARGAVEVEWFDLDDPRSPKDDLRTRGASRGGAIFARGEGMWHGGDSIYWACTEGGAKLCGQLWRYTPSQAEGTPGEADHPGRLELFVEPNDGAILRNADNITVAPWGDLIVCEDNLEDNRLLGVTRRGEVYALARNTRSKSELAGATFSPDGTTLFVNIQEPGSTLAIRGPWR